MQMFSPHMRFIHFYFKCIPFTFFCFCQVSFSDDGLSLLAALGSGDVAVVDLRMVREKKYTNVLRKLSEKENLT